MHRDYGHIHLCPANHGKSYQGQYQQAHDLAHEVISNGPYVLETDYMSNFDFENPYSSESIFEVDFTEQDGNSLAFWHFEDDLGGRYEYGVNLSLVNAYEATEPDPNPGLTLADGPGCFPISFSKTHEQVHF